MTTDRFYLIKAFITFIVIVLQATLILLKVNNIINIGWLYVMLPILILSGVTLIFYIILGIIIIFTDRD